MSEIANSSSDKVKDFLWEDLEPGNVVGEIADTYCLLQNYKVALDKHAILVVTDLQGKIVYVNDMFCKLSQYSAEELVGKTHSIVNSGFHSKEFFHTLWETISDGKIWSGMICNLAKDGTAYWVKTTIFPFKNRRGDISNYFSVCTDITELVRAHDELKHTQSLLEIEKETLRSKNLALKELLNHLDEEKKNVLRTIRTNFEYAIFPLLDKILEHSPSAEKYIELVKSNLNQIGDPVLRQTQEIGDTLSPKELQICNLVKQGLSAKEIARLMHLSLRTIDKHRENIRKKLNLANRKINLATYLVNHFQ